MDALRRLAPPIIVNAARSAELDRAFDERWAGGVTLAFRVAYGVLRQREDAEDVAQEALARAYRRRHTLRDPERFEGWLVRIAWRLAIDRRRGDRRRERREGLYSAPEPRATVEEMASDRERQERVLRAIDSLPTKLRIALVLFGIEGHGVREVASLLGLPEGTVKSRVHQARRRLLEALR